MNKNKMHIPKKKSNQIFNNPPIQIMNKNKIYILKKKINKIFNNHSPIKIMNINNNSK